MTGKFCAWFFEAGSPGTLPKDLAAKVERFKLQRFQVNRRILRMNKKLENEFGEDAADQRGWHWALTSFAAEADGKSKIEIENT